MGGSSAAYIHSEIPRDPAELEDDDQPCQQNDDLADLTETNALDLSPLSAETNPSPTVPIAPNTPSHPAEFEPLAASSTQLTP